MKNVAYMRVSTNDGRQSTERQFGNDLSSFDLTFEDHISGAKEHRPELDKCLSVLEKDDVLHVHEISRLSRNLDHLRGFVTKLLDKGISIKFHKEGLEFCADENEPMKKAVSTMMLSLLGAIAEFERGMISSRIKEALAVKKAKGIKLGAAAPAYNRNPKKSVSVRNRAEAKERTSAIADQIRLIIDSLDVSPTYAKLASILTRHKVMLPSGVEGEWKPMQANRICKRFDIQL